MREQLVERTMEFEVQTRIGKARAICLSHQFEEAEHLALVFGDVGSSMPVRIHREKLLDDVFGSQTNHPQNLLDVSLDRIEQLGGGVLIYLRSGTLACRWTRSKTDQRGLASSCLAGNWCRCADPSRSGTDEHSPDRRP